MRAPTVALVEVSADALGGAPVDLVRAAYRASREGRMALLLDGVTTAQVDRALDPLVPVLRGVSGVVYCTAATLEPVLDGSGWPTMAFIGSEALAARLAPRGVRVLPAEAALAALCEWAAEPVREVAC
jgi:hypothetical protein